jgi:hypothetical protein
MASPFHGVGDFEHHQFAMTAPASGILQNLPDATDKKPEWFTASEGADKEWNA